RPVVAGGRRLPRARRSRRRCADARRPAPRRRPPPALLPPPTYRDSIYLKFGVLLGSQGSAGFYTVQFYRVQFYRVQFYKVQFCEVQFCEAPRVLRGAKASTRFEEFYEVRRVLPGSRGHGTLRNA